MEYFEGLPIKEGYSTIRAWEPGAIQRLLNEGYSLKEAQERLTPLHENTVHNLVVSVGKYMVGDVLIDEETTGLTYHAIGTGTDAPSVGDSTLTTESTRKAFTSRTRSGNVITLSCYYTAAQCTYNIKECGIFGGASATASTDSGVLFSHYLQTYDNSGGTKDLTFDYALTIS